MQNEKAKFLKVQTSVSIIWVSNENGVTLKINKFYNKIHFDINIAIFHQH